MIDKNVFLGHNFCTDLWQEINHNNFFPSFLNPKMKIMVLRCLLHLIQKEFSLANPKQNYHIFDIACDHGHLALGLSKILENLATMENYRFAFINSLNKAYEKSPSKDSSIDFMAINKQENFFKGLFAKTTILGSDISVSSVKKAKAAREKWQPSWGQLNFIFNDGLTGLNIPPASIICIAGLGGKSILDILHNSSPLTKPLFLLHPTHSLPELRLNLKNWGADARFEWLLNDENQAYRIFEYEAGKFNSHLSIIKRKMTYLMPLNIYQVQS